MEDKLAEFMGAPSMPVSGNAQICSTSASTQEHKSNAAGWKYAGTILRSDLGSEAFPRKQTIVSNRPCSTEAP